uniref:Zinc finger PHD-type domain-containing protein n=1 Tax=Lygus hesperus TaxID=30085 RepID=A0A0K8S7G4_LYGHE
MACSKCDQPLLSEDAISCASCKDDLHFGCAGLYERNFRRMNEKKLSWKCSKCVLDSASSNNDFLKSWLVNFETKMSAQASANTEELKGLITGLTDKVDACLANYESLNSRVEYLKADFDSKHENVNRRLSEIEKVLPNTTVASVLPGASGGQDAEFILAELEDRRRRASNILIFGIPESFGAATADLADNKEAGSHPELLDEVNSDLAKIKDCLNKLKPEFVDSVVRVSRIGRPDASRSRPIKVIFQSPLAASRVLMANRATRPPIFSASNDKTPAQQSYLNDLRETLKRRTEAGETDLTIRYVSGTPKIVHASTLPTSTYFPKNGEHPVPYRGSTRTPEDSTQS